MRAYNIGDKVYFYICVARNQIVEGEIREIVKPDVYMIMYDNGKYEIHGQFITGLVISDKEIITKLEERILNDDKKLQVLYKRIVEADKEIAHLKETVSRQKSRISELERVPFNGYNYKKRRKTSPSPDIPPMVPQWRCDLDDHERYRQKYACGFLEY